MLLIYTHTIEGCEAERADLEVGDFLAQRLEHRRVGNRHDRDLMLKDLLCLLVQIDPLLFVSGHFGLLNQFLVPGATPASFSSARVLVRS